MVGFTMSAQASSSNSSSNNNNDKEISNEQWQEWNVYLHNLTDASEVDLGDGKHKKTQTSVGILNLMIEAGFQPQTDAEYDTRCALPEEGEKNSKEELEVIEKFPSNYFKWVDDKGTKKRKQCRPQNPEQELILCIDFPDLMVDYSKHPNSDLETEDLKPLRVSLNGRFKKDFNRHIVLRLNKDAKMSAKNLMYKIAEKSGKLQEFIDSKYNPGVLAGAACKWSVDFQKNVSGDSTFYSIQAVDPTSIEEVKAGKVTVSVADQIPECSVPFTGIMLNSEEEGAYSEDVLKNIRREFLNVMKKCVAFKPSPIKYPDFVLGCNWEDTDLAKALKASIEKNNPKEDSSSKEQSKAEEEVEVADNDNTPLSEDDGFDEDIPF